MHKIYAKLLVFAFSFSALLDNVVSTNIEDANAKLQGSRRSGTAAGCARSALNNFKKDDHPGKYKDAGNHKSVYRVPSSTDPEIRPWRFGLVILLGRLDQTN